MSTTLLYPGVSTQKCYYSWTKAAAAANDTIVVSGKVLEVRAYDNDASGTTDVNITWSVSTSGNEDTVTIQAIAAVTAGTIAVEFIPR